VVRVEADFDVRVIHVDFIVIVIQLFSQFFCLQNGVTQSFAASHRRIGAANECISVVVAGANDIHVERLVWQEDVR